MRFLSALMRLLREGGAARVGQLLVLMVLGGMTDGVGILLLVPLLALLQANPARARGVGGALLAALRGVGIAPSLGGVLLVFVALVGLRSVILHVRDQQGLQLERHVVDRLRERAFRALMAAEWRWLVRRRESDHANLLLGEVARVGVGLHFGVGLLASLAAIAAYLVVAFALSWQMAAVAVASGVLVFALSGGQQRGAVRLGEALGQANRALQRDVQESLGGIKLAKILGQEQRHVDRLVATAAELRDQQRRFTDGNGRMRAWTQAGGAALLAGYVYAGIVVLDMPMPELLTLVLVFGRLVPLCLQAQTLHYQWLNALPALESAERLLAECRAAAEPQAEGEARSWAVASGIVLDGVTVRHDGRDRPSLDDVSVTFAARTTTAVMGPSGAGKSTLADVLIGLAGPDAGALRVDGVAIEGALRKSWRRAVAYVPQDTFLFHDSIRNNLLWAAPGADDAQLRAALRQAAADFVFDLPRQLDTVVGDRGSRLSGGERQRIALARALLTRPALLILDEATSALDVDNEARVRRAIEQLHGDLTVVVIGHRLPTLEHADRVLVLEEGRVAAFGSWAQVRQASQG